MRIDIMTLFPELCDSVLSESIIGRARTAGYVTIACHNIRDYTLDKHDRVDDAPYGGGMGMVMQAQPIYDCFAAVPRAVEGQKPHLIYLSPQGKTLTQERVKELATLPQIVLLCGHYEGVDERVIDEIVDEEISIGDYVLTGGELPACVLTDAVCRLLPGVLPKADAYEIESHYGHLLEYPQYTRPPVWRDRTVPEILLSGDHAKVDRYHLKEALKRTRSRRPDMLADIPLSKAERELLEEVEKEQAESEEKLP